MKRYAIVRVDNKCPAYENINLCDEEYTTCEDCKVNDNYGDTKKQFIAKVKQALVRARIEEDENSKSLSWEQIATRIVEFLGVE